jgi:hypothetical protein
VKEVRAWTIHVGDTGPQAAGVIHTDFEKGYIRAQTIAFEDFIAFKGEQGAKDAGKMRAEGKDEEGASADWILATYGRCLAAVTGLDADAENDPPDDDEGEDGDDEGTAKAAA